MKKSFKKAGAAVLSMAMLLSMGAVLMPVFAADPYDWPGQVIVEINKDNKWADETYTQAGTGGATVTKEFDYLAEASTAEVKMYKVATLGTNGWAWESDFVGAVNDYYKNADGTNTTDVLNDFQKLLAVEKDNADPAKEHFTATSAELLQLASALERVVRQGSITEVASGTIDFANGNSVKLPGDTSLTSTMNTIGYYLIATTTDDAGVVLQPVLITLKNGTNEDVKKISIKGYNIDVQKTIETVVDKDEGVSLGGTVIGTAKDNAIVAKEDVITYKIETEIPKYDVALDASLAASNPKAMKNFEIIDVPSSGIKVTKESAGSDGNNSTYAPVNLVVKATDGTTTWTLTEGVANDYTVVATADDFKIVFTPSQYHTNANSTTHKLEGMTITATFEAIIDDANFKTADYSGADYDDLDATKFNAQNDVVTKEGQYQAASTANFGSNSTNADVIKDAIKETLHGVGAAVSTVTDAEMIAAYLAKEAAGSSATYGGLTKAQIEAKLSDAEAIIAAHTKYDTAKGSEDFNSTNLAENTAKLKKALGRADDTALTEAEIVKAVLALEALQLTPLGNDNTGRITYGNEYSTAQGNGQDDDTATVYSVDLDLTKITEKITLATTANYLTEDKEDEWFEQTDATETPVKGAIFDLVKKDESSRATADKKDKSVGLAISDADGKLWMLTKGTAVRANSDGSNKPEVADTIAEGNVVYVETVEHAAVGTEGQDGYVAAYTEYVPYTVEHLSGDTNKAWRKLTQGNYILKELQAPAGYKTIPDLTITVAPEKTTSSTTVNEVTQTTSTFTGKFAASTNDGDGDIVRSDAVTAGDNGALDYVGVDGALEARIIDPPNDTLPATGGIGTVLFTAGGISVVLIAGALFVMYMKKRNAEDEE